MLLLLFIAHCLTSVTGHGRLRQPPSRSTMWRYGFDTPTNVNDHESNCGGYGRQWSQNQGLCGVCGDAYDLPQPRPGELGGQYGLGVLAANLSQGQLLEVEVEHCMVSYNHDQHCNHTNILHLPIPYGQPMPNN